jgi:ACS family hexuronate transporter-like MFS transporter
MFIMPNATVSRPATSHVRWVICALLFFATVIAYVDRNVLSVLEKTLEGILHFDSVQYGKMTGAFQFGYAIAMLVAGRLTDRLGTRKAFALAIVFWSLAAMTPGAATSAATLGIAMFLLGLGEAANFPACNKTIAEWFPKRERAFAFGLFNAGANIGSMAAPLLVPGLVYLFGWRGAFVAAGATGFVWLVFWLRIYARPEQHRKVSAGELELILSDPPDRIESTPWVRLFPCKETWAYALGKLLTDPVWWFWGFWLPRYVQGTFGLTMKEASFPVTVAFAASFIGSVGGGWLSSALLKRGKSLNVSRKSAMLICAVCVIPVIYAPYSKSLWVVVALVGLAAAAHQGWSTNLFTLVSDMFPKTAVGSVTGIGGMVGAIGGALTQWGIGHAVKASGGYTGLFLTAGMAYLIALAIIHALSPKLAPAKLD